MNEMSKITVGTSGLTNTIYAGRLNKAGNQWVGEKHDVTDAVVSAAMQHVYQNAVNSKSEYAEITVRDFKGYDLKIYAKKITENAANPE